MDAYNLQGYACTLFDRWPYGKQIPIGNMGIMLPSLVYAT